MKNQAILRVRFAYNDAITSFVDRINRFESFLYNVYHLHVRKKAMVSFEIVVVQGSIDFYIVANRAMSTAVTLMLYANFPDAEVLEVDQYNNFDAAPKSAVAFSAKLVGSESFTLRTASEKHGDPLNMLFNLLSEVPAEDAVMYQVLMRPIDELVQQEERSSIYGTGEKEILKERKPKLHTNIRALYFTTEHTHVTRFSTSFENVFNPFSTERNVLEVKHATDIQKTADAIMSHELISPDVFTTEELANLFHSPEPQAKIRGIDWVYSRKAEPPMSLPTPENTSPEDISLFGTSNFHGKQVDFGLHREDRRRHLYVVGKSGVGKTKLLERLISDDIKAGKGVCVIDPHGDLIQSMMLHVPKERINDVVYFSPSDLAYPIAFNPLENVAREFKQQVTQGMIEIFKKFFGGDWTPKIEHVFRFTVLALLDYKHATIMGMQKMLTDRAYRQLVIADIKDAVVKKFWANEFSGWSEKFDNEAIVPLVNKLGQFLSNEMVRNIVAQPKNKVDFKAIMNEQKILFVELSKGKLGEENSSLLGSLLITRIEQEGMARAFIAEKKRKDFYLYVDEFQNFSTRSFDNMLSESRKYRLNLTLSHQYLGQLAKDTRDTIFGNVSSLITFRVGAEDAAYLAHELAPRFGGHDIMNLGVREIYVKMSIGGLVTPAFSARTMDVEEPDVPSDWRDQIINASRKKYATPLADVEKEQIALYGGVKTAGSSAAQATVPADDEEQEFAAPLI